MKNNTKLINFSSQFPEIGHVIALVNVIYAFVGLKDAKERTENYMRSTYDAAAGVFVSVQEQLSLLLEKQLADAGDKVKELESKLKALVDGANTKDVKDEMPPDVKRVQAGLLIGAIALMCLGTTALMGLLQNFSETLADDDFKALSIALSGTLLVGIGIKNLISIIPHAGLQHAFAGVVCFVGVASGVGALIGNATIYAPISADKKAEMLDKILNGGDQLESGAEDFSETSWNTSAPDEVVNEAAPVDEFSGVDWNATEDISEGIVDGYEPASNPKIVADATASDSSFWDIGLGSKILILTVFSESALSAILLWRWGRTRKRFRLSSIYKTPEYIAAKKAHEEAVEAYNLILEKLLTARGSLDAIAAERANFVQIGLAKLTTLQD